jgi:hypothetical protein
MEQVPLGRYRLRISQQQLDKLKLRATSEETVEISVDNQFINGIDFKLVNQ